MGSSSSRLGSRRSGNRVKLSSFICGGSPSRAPLEMEDHSDEILVNSSEHCDPVNEWVRNPMSESSSASRMGTVVAGLNSSTGTTGESRVLASEDISSERKEPVASDQVTADCSHNKSYSDRSSATASTSLKEEQSSDSVSVNFSANKDVVNGIDNSVRKGASDIGSEVSRPSSSSPSGLTDRWSNRASVENHMDEVSQVTAINNTDSASVPRASDSPVAFNGLRDDFMQEAVPSGLGFLVSNREEDQGDGSVLQVDVVSISSNIFSSSSTDPINHEARRNSRRLFWDAFSRRNSRRHIDSPTIVFSAGDSNDPESHDRWLLDFSGDFIDDGVGSDYGYLGSRINRLNERRRHSRSMIWESLRSDLDENGRRTTSCPTGLHPDGSCSCESFLVTEDSSTRGSISRIVLLAETLFEVLDEVHRQTVSLSLSMVSLPAPESVVDSFPLKSHKKNESAAGGDDIAQCYICLAEYEEGDKIRVLPCHHEFHMSCVDKWLKEIHGVCPLCRGDVRQVDSQCTAPQPEVHSLR